MDLFQQADAMVNTCSGMFGVIAIPLLIYLFFFRKKKKI
jgi:hypothetical protein